MTAKLMARSLGNHALGCALPPFNIAHLACAILLLLRWQLGTGFRGEEKVTADGREAIGLVLRPADWLAKRLPGGSLRH